MNREVSEEEALFKYIRIFLAQYLSSIHNYGTFQNQALNILANYLLKLITKLTSQVKSILAMQSRSEPNCLHLLLANEETKSFDLQKLLTFLIKRREENIDLKPLGVIEKLGRKIFEIDSESINNYPRERLYQNIKYVRPIYTLDLEDKCLPYRSPLDQIFIIPPEMSYQATFEKTEREKKNIQSLVSYTKRQNKVALIGLLVEDEQKQLTKNNQQGRNQMKDENEMEEKVEIEDGMGFNGHKKVKFDSINFL